MNLTNHFLIAASDMPDSFFSGSVVLICEHGEHGAMGIVINKPAPVKMDTIFATIGKATPMRFLQNDVVLGGPVQPERGFMLHTPLGKWQSSLKISDSVALTTSRDIVESMAKNLDVKDAVLALGYARWEAGQLENEIARNDWQVVLADETILFEMPSQLRYQAAFEKLGIAPEKWVGAMGHA